MLKQYFKQAWNLIKQEKLFSSVYIIGTGLSITMVMALSIVLYVRVGNIYPETNRDRMLIVKVGQIEVPNNTRSGHLSYGLANSFRDVESVEAVAIVYSGNDYVQSPDKKEDIPVALKYVDNDFWKVFPFHFKQGKPFEETEVQSGVKTVVIAESLSKRVFGTAESTGRYITLDYEDYRVSGVVKDVSYITPQSYAQIWIPYTVMDNYKESWGEGDFLGDAVAYILAPSILEIEKVKQDIHENTKRYNANYPDITFSMLGQPDRQWQTIFRSWQDPDFTKIAWQYGLIFFILLFVPAVSLSGMTDSRMKRRLSEMGIRRTFGSPKNKLMTQIISENFLFTLLGGIVGLILSYLTVIITKDWIFQIGSDFINLPPEGTQMILKPDMLLNVQVFLTALLVCFILNLLSALIPAWRASNREIIYSLNVK